MASKILVLYRLQSNYSLVSAMRSQSPVDMAQPESRSMSPLVKKSRKAIYTWGPNGTFIIHRYSNDWKKY